MRYFVLERETSVEEIAGKAYRNLPTAERRKAEEALVKANPRLTNMANLRSGALIRIPERADIGRLDRRNVVDPVDHLVDGVSNQLETFMDEFRDSFGAWQKQVKTYGDLVKAASKQAKEVPEIETVAKELSRHVRAAKKNNEKNEEMGMDALKKLGEVAAALARR